MSTKIAVIVAVEVRTKLKSEVADSFGLNKSTVSTVPNLNFKEREFELQRKRIRTAVYGEIEEALFPWFKQARSMNIPVSGPILTIKAKELALKLGHQDFICSSGWLQRFKSRHDIVFRKIA